MLVLWFATTPDYAQRDGKSQVRLKYFADQSLETVRTIVRQQWEQQAKRTKKPSAPAKTRHRKPDEPDMGR